MFIYSKDSFKLLNIFLKLDIKMLLSHIHSILTIQYFFRFFLFLFILPRVTTKKTEKVKFYHKTIIISSRKQRVLAT